MMHLKVASSQTLEHHLPSQGCKDVFINAYQGRGRIHENESKNILIGQLEPVF